MFNQIRKPTQVRQKSEKCEIVVEKTAKGVRRKIVGCSKEQLKALEGYQDGED